MNSSGVIATNFHVIDKPRAVAAEFSPTIIVSLKGNQIRAIMPSYAE